ncbi:hypothetical protein [Kineococcus sp. NUM-3379]
MFVGEVTRGAAYTCVQAAPRAEELTPAAALSPDAGGAGNVVRGEFFEAPTGTVQGTRVAVGGRPALVTGVGVDAYEDGDDRLVFTAPADLTGVQDVVVTTRGGSVHAGAITYSAVVPTFTRTPPPASRPS